MVSPKNIVELRNLLAQKFPGLKTSAAHSRSAHSFSATGWPRLDHVLQGGFSKGAITEIISPAGQGGGASVLRRLLLQQQRLSTWTALIDGRDSFDPAPFQNSALSKLLWVRCQHSEQAVKAADLLLRDRNLAVVILDLGLNPAPEVRRISASTWYRFQRLIEGTASIFIALTPAASVSHAQARIALQIRPSLNALSARSEDFLAAAELTRLEAAHEPEQSSVSQSA